MFLFFSALFDYSRVRTASSPNGGNGAREKKQEKRKFSRSLLLPARPDKHVRDLPEPGLRLVVDPAAPRGPGHAAQAALDDLGGRAGVEAAAASPAKAATAATAAAAAKRRSASSAAGGEASSAPASSAAREASAASTAIHSVSLVG